MIRPYFFSATSKADEKQTLLYHSLSRMVEHGFICSDDFEFKTGNCDGLAKCYNEVLDRDWAQDRVIVFVHDDVLLDDLYLVEKLSIAFSADESIVGVGIAGAKKVTRRDTPMLWHLMGGKGNLAGEASHFYRLNEGEVPDCGAPNLTTVFGFHGPVCLLDGVFMAIDPKRLNGVRFDEKCPSKWNFYDLNFSLSCVLSGLKLVTRPIRLIHMSPGLTERTEDWSVGDKYFRDRLISITQKSN